MILICIASISMLVAAKRVRTSAVDRADLEVMVGSAQRDQMSVYKAHRGYNEASRIDGAESLMWNQVGVGADRAPGTAMLAVKLNVSVGIHRTFPTFHNFQQCDQRWINDIAKTPIKRRSLHRDATGLSN